MNKIIVMLVKYEFANSFFLFANIHNDTDGFTVINTKAEYSHQPPRPINLTGLPSWKMSICSRHWGLLENNICLKTR